MLKKLWLTALIATSLCAFARPAGAAVTASLSNPTYPTSTTCPYNLTVPGTISGPPGTNVSYWFGRFNIPGPPHSPTFNAAIPTSGTLNVADSIPVTQSLANGTTYSDQIYVSSQNVYSNTITFKPTCTGSIGSVVQQPSTIIHLAMFDLTQAQTGWTEYHYAFYGMSGSIAEGGLGCAPLCVGWLHYKQGDSAWLQHENDFWRTYMTFDLSKIAGLHVKSAALEVPFTGSSTCLGAIGRATRDWRGQNGQTLTQSDATNGDFSNPQTAHLPHIGVIGMDVTQIVQAWANNPASNFGFVFRGRVEDNGSDGNDSCTMSFGTNPVLHIKM